MEGAASAFRAFDIDRVAARRTRAGFASLEYRAETGSTNADALARLGDDDAAGSTIVADHQTHGAGRKGRRWFAPPYTSLLFTTTLRRPIETSALWALPFWCALAVADAVETAAVVRLALKWPNDLMLGERKCAGILCISRVTGDRAHVACGIGIDVRRPVDALLHDIEPPPAFLSDAAPGVERETILAAILDRFAADEFALETPDRVARRWEARAGLDGTTYRLTLDSDGEVRVGVARRLGESGALILEIDGRETAVDLADASVVRERAT